MKEGGSGEKGECSGQTQSKLCFVCSNISGLEHAKLRCALNDQTSCTRRGVMGYTAAKCVASAVSDRSILHWQCISLASTARLGLSH